MKADLVAGVADFNPVRRLPALEVFWIFLRAGCAFGGGLGIVSVLEDEIVTRRAALDRAEFLRLYALSRVTPIGTMSALAVAYGRRFAGFPGTVAALAGLSLPALASMIALTLAYGALRESPLLHLVPGVVVPAALVIVVAATIRLSRPILRLSPDLTIAAAAFGAVFLLGWNVALVLLLGGAVGAVLLRERQGQAR